MSSDSYELSEESEINLIKNKDAVQMIDDDIPNVIPKIGVKESRQLLDNDVKDKKRLLK